MKKLTFIIGLTISLMAANCEDWYKNIRSKYKIVGTKTGVVMDKNGKWKKLFAKGTASVDFSDEDEYEDALMEAEEEAKANMVHFLKEEVYSDRFINDISKKLKENSSSSKNQTTQVNKKTLKVTAKSIHNNAHSLLKGIVTLCESIDKNKKRAVVIIGVSPKTQMAADSARESMHENHKSGDLNKIVTPINIQNSMDSSDSLDF